MLLIDKLKTKAAVAISTLGSATNNILVDRTHANDPNLETEQVNLEPVNIYDIIHAAWDLRVQRLEEFAARYLAYRLEDYIDEPEFADLIQESASRIKKREETDTIELLDDIRYYLSDRFRLRFEDANLDDIMTVDEDGNPKAEEELMATGGEIQAANGGSTNDGAEQQVLGSESKKTAVGQTTGVVRTLDGEEVDDEFDLDAQNYQILLRKIDDMLERLKLDA